MKRILTLLPGAIALTAYERLPDGQGRRIIHAQKIGPESSSGSTTGGDYKILPCCAILTANKWGEESV